MIKVPPFLHLHAGGRRALDLALAHLVPVRAQHCTSTLLEALQHRPALIIRRILIDSLQRIESKFNTTVFVSLKSVGESYNQGKGTRESRYQ